jgi:hypothetical protein
MGSYNRTNIVLGRIRIGKPLAALSGKYKLNGFYYSIGKFGPIERPKIDNIQLISLCREKHITFWMERFWILDFSSIASFCRYCYYTQRKLMKKEICLCEHRSITDYNSDLTNKRGSDNNHNGVKYRRWKRDYFLVPT